MLTQYRKLQNGSHPKSRLSICFADGFSVIRAESSGRWRSGVKCLKRSGILRLEILDSAAHGAGIMAQAGPYHSLSFAVVASCWPGAADAALGSDSTRAITSLLI